MKTKFTGLGFKTRKFDVKSVVEFNPIPFAEHHVFPVIFLRKYKSLKDH